MDACRDIFFGHNEYLLKRSIAISKSVYQMYFTGYDRPNGDASERVMELSIAYFWLWLHQKGLLSEITPIHTFCAMIVRHTPADYLKIKHGDRYLDGLWSKFSQACTTNQKEIQDIFKILKSQTIRIVTA